MPDEYIPKGISSRIVVMENNSSERKGYGADLVENIDEKTIYIMLLGLQALMNREF